LLDPLSRVGEADPEMLEPGAAVPSNRLAVPRIADRGQRLGNLVVVGAVRRERHLRLPCALRAARSDRGQSQPGSLIALGTAA
jgi:hypothetical protein